MSIPTEGRALIVKYLMPDNRGSGMEKLIFISGAAARWGCS